MISYQLYYNLYLPRCQIGSWLPIAAVPVQSRNCWEEYALSTDFGTDCGLTKGQADYASLLIRVIRAQYVDSVVSSPQPDFAQALRGAGPRFD